MASVKGRRKSDLLPYVKRHRDKFRGWWRESGKTRYTASYYTQEEAHEAAVRMRKALESPEGGPLTLEGGMQLVRLALRKRGRKEETARFYDEKFRRLLRMFEESKRLDSFTRKDVEEYIRRRIDLDKVSPNTVKLELLAFGRIFNVAMAAGRCGQNPVKFADRPEPVPTRMDVFEWKDALEIVERINEAGELADADMIALCLYTGLRRAEVARLKATDLSEGRIFVDGKTGGRYLPAPEGLQKLVERMAARGGRGVVSGPDQKARGYHITRTFQRWADRLKDRRLHPHAMRHTFASELARRGTPEYVIADLLGHARARSSITQRYVSVFGPEAVRAMTILWTGEAWIAGPAPKA